MTSGGFTDVLWRHVYYLATILNVVLLAENPFFLAVTLSWILFLTIRDANVSLAYVSANCLLFPLVEHVAVRYSSHTWKYAHPMESLFLRVPVWLFPLWGLASIWIADVFILTSDKWRPADGAAFARRGRRREASLTIVASPKENSSACARSFE